MFVKYDKLTFWILQHSTIVQNLYLSEQGSPSSFQERILRALQDSPFSLSPLFEGPSFNDRFLTNKIYSLNTSIVF